MQSKPKKLIVYCDGTWNRSDQQTVDHRPCPTNVLKLFEATKLHDENGNLQITHYIEGVGTRKRERIMGGGFGYGTSDNVMNGYSFIVSNYEDGDEIFVFGFSRGAYAARSIAGLIRNSGILRRENMYFVREAFRIYKDKSSKWHPDSKDSKHFRKIYAHPNEEPIKFIGVWDTVGALGAPFGSVPRWFIDKIFKCGFHDETLSSKVKSAYQALAIDERRWPFRPTLWRLKPIHESRNDISQKKNGFKLYEQKWFPGVHSNVGGGYPETGLSDCALEWMASKAKLHGLKVDLQLLNKSAKATESNSKLRKQQVFKPNPKEKIEDSQTFYYRNGTKLTANYLSWIKTLLPKDKSMEEEIKLIPFIQSNGDYIRPITDQDDISDPALEKIKIDKGYRPMNIKAT